MMRRVMLLLLGSIALCNGCGKGEKYFAPTVLMPVVACPAPIAPELPAINGTLPLDGPENVDALMLRDDLMRWYIRGLERCVECYDRQATVGPGR